MDKSQLIAERNYNNLDTSTAGRKLSLYYIKNTGFFITMVKINYIESVDELTAKEHYKFCETKHQKFPKSANTRTQQ